MPFYGREGIILGYKIFAKGIEVDKTRIEVIEWMPPPSKYQGDKKLSWTYWIL